MIPTLLVGDYLFVSKYSYGYSRYSFPFGLDLFQGRVMFSDPHRGDVIVFKTPRDNSTDYIKRLVGLPATGFQMIGGVLEINGELSSASVLRMSWKIQSVGRVRRFINIGRRCRVVSPI